MNSDDALALSLEQKVDQVCTRFESAWKTDTQPRIEDHVANLSDAENPEVVRELILLDVFYRRQRGDSCVPEDYQARFPAIEPAWLAKALDPAASGPTATVDEPRLAERPGSCIGPYKLLQQIGEGGMGTVFMAEQTEPVRRRVALKVIKAGMDTRQVIARFEAERQALAMMDHPNIAKVFDGGTTGGEPGGVSPGSPYFVMELVKGVAITKYCDDHHLTPRQRLELFLPVCQAVQHAHQKGIIHRDLKPSNVLIALYDGKPVPKVIDFGVAKAVGGGLTDKTLFTDFGAVVGTLEYMSPEQAEPNQLDIDTRSDLYALGVLLYELLTGSTPLNRKHLKEAAFLECLRIIREDEPQKPSTRLSTAEQLPSVAANRGLEPKKLTGVVRGDLDWIVMKCLEKDRNRRYETANGLAMDVQRYLADEPVLASPPSAVYRLRKFARRHKAGLLTATTALLVVVFVASGVSWVLWDRAAQETVRADQETVRRSELARRELDTEKAVTFALVKAEQSEKRAKQLPCTTSVEAKATLPEWRDAMAALAEAKAALATGAAADGLLELVADTRRRIEAERMQAQRKEQLFRDLDDARMTAATWKESNFDYAGAAAKYAEAFAAFGLEVQPQEKEVLAERICAEEPAVRDALILALDFWAFGATPPIKADLLAIAHAADQDTWRRECRLAKAGRDGAALVRLSEEAHRLTLPPSSLQLLAYALIANHLRDEAVGLLRWARGRYSADFWIALELGNRLDRGKATLPLDLEERIGCFRVAVALRPDASAAHVNLGNALTDKNQLDDAIAEYKTAITLDPKLAFAHHNLGIALKAKNLLDYAIAEYKIAITLDPKYAEAHVNLGSALQANNQWDDAIAEFKLALALDPKLAIAHNNIGVVLQLKNQWDDAIAEYKIAIKLDPKYAMAHYRLGFTFYVKNQWEDAIAEFKIAIMLDPEHALAHLDLGNALKETNRLDDAIAEYKKAVALDTNSWLAPGALGLALIYKGRFAEAKASTQHSLDLQPEKHLLRPAVLRQRDRCDVLLALEAKLPDVLAGKARPKDDREWLGFIEVCQYQHRHFAAAKLYGDAFTADAKLGDDLDAGHRYKAARFAALAAGGQGIDADKLDDKEHTRLRKQASDWLHADLALWTIQAATDKAGDRALVQKKMKHWQEDTDLASIRDKDALAKLPNEEREACQKLWADVGALLEKASTSK